MPGSDSSRLQTLSQTVQVVSVAAGVVISVLSFNQARVREAAAREAEAETRRFELTRYFDQRKDLADQRQIEAARPFLEIRQKRYSEAIKAAGVLVTPELHTAEETRKARKRFWELYWAELSMVEGSGVEARMAHLGRLLEPGRSPTPQQLASYRLAHSLRDSLIKSWGVNEKIVEKSEE
jgi:hypothetical protein